jgi:hypothetical protein
MEPLIATVTSLASNLPSNLSPRVSLPVLSNQEKRAFQACKRMHYLRYRLLKRPVGSSESSRLGSAVRQGLHAWWRAAMAREDRLCAALAAIDAFAANPSGLASLDHADRIKADALLTAYDARWSQVAIEVLAVEAEFTVPIVNPASGMPSRTYALGGTIDAIVRLADGLVYVVAHKTTTEGIEPEGEYWQRLHLDPQAPDAFVGARALGFDVAGCLYDVVAKPRLTPLSATPVEKRQYTKKDGRLYAGQREADETLAEFRARLDLAVAELPDRYFARTIAPRVEEAEREAALDTWNTARDIREADLALRHPRNPDACKRWGQLCAYFRVCTGAANVEDPTLFRADDAKAVAS